MEIAIGIMATIISLAALYFVYYQIEMSREHNRLSVRPKLNYDFTDVNILDKPLGIKIKNNGLGPGIITKFKVTLEDRISTENHNLGWLGFLENSKHAHSEVAGYWFNIGDTIKMGEEIDLISISKEGLTLKRRKDIGVFIDELIVNIEYKSMYGEKFKLNWIKPDNFMK